MSKDRRIVDLHHRGIDEVEIACRLMIGLHAVRAAIAKVRQQLAAPDEELEAAAAAAEEIGPEPSAAAAHEPFEAPKEITLPKAYATGGIVVTTGVFGFESGPEAILPLQKAPAVVAADASVPATSSCSDAGSAPTRRRSSPRATTPDPAAPSTRPTRPSVTSLPVSSPFRSLPLDPPSVRGGAVTVIPADVLVESLPCASHALPVEAPARWAPYRPSSWTEEREAVLREMWQRGESAGEIAAVLGGITRNSVIGKAHRLQLVSPAARIAPTRAPVAPIDRGNLAPLPPSPVRRPNRDPAGTAGLTDRSPFSTCQWIEGEPQTRIFCGAPVLERGDGRRSSYCAEHHGLCWVLMRPHRSNTAARDGYANPKDAA